MKNTIIPLLITLFSFSLGYTQQATFYSLFHSNLYNSHTAYAGFDKSLSVNFHIRNQWNGLEGGVQSQTINAHLPLYVISGGVGVLMRRDVSGPLQIVESAFSYNYVQSYPIGTFSFSGSLGLGQISLDGSEIRTPDGIYDPGSIDHQDDDLPIEKVSGPYINAGASIFFVRGNLKVGASAGNLLAQAVTLGNDFGFGTSRFFNLSGQYDYEILEDIAVTGHAQLMSDMSQTQLQIGAHVTYENNISAGAAFRGYGASSKDALILTTGIRINRQFTLFYAYDVLISELNAISTNNTHEFALNYNLNELIRTGLPPKVIYNPRF